MKTYWRTSHDKFYLANFLSPKYFITKKVWFILPDNFCSGTYYNDRCAFSKADLIRRALLHILNDMLWTYLLLHYGKEIYLMIKELKKKIEERKKRKKNSTINRLRFSFIWEECILAIRVAQARNLPLFANELAQPEPVTFILYFHLEEVYSHLSYFSLKLMTKSASLLINSFPSNHFSLISWFILSLKHRSDIPYSMQNL